MRSEIDVLLSGVGNGTSNNDSDTTASESLYELIVIIGGIIIFFLVIGLIVARKKLGWLKPKKRYTRNHLFDTGIIHLSSCKSEFFFRCLCGA